VVKQQVNNMQIDISEQEMRNVLALMKGIVNSMNPGDIDPVTGAYTEEARNKAFNQIDELRKD